MPRRWAMPIFTSSRSEDGRFLVSGNARLDDLSEHLGFELDAEGIDTIGGFVFNRLGYLPPTGTKLEISASRHYRARSRPQNGSRNCLLEKNELTLSSAAVRDCGHSSFSVAGLFRFSSTESKPDCSRSIRCACARKRNARPRLCD